MGNIKKVERKKGGVGILPGIELIEREFVVTCTIGGRGRIFRRFSFETY